MRGARGLVTAGLTCFCVFTGALVCVTPGLASTGHGLTGAFGSGSSTPSNPNPLSDPSGVAVDQNTGDVYVVDAGNSRVEKFDGSGHFLLAFGTDVGGTGVNTCSSVCLAGVAGSGEGQFSAPTEISVDNSGVLPGDVYVLDAGNNRIEKFSPAGVYLSQIDGTGANTGRGPTTPFGQLKGVAIAPSGSLWVYQANAEIDQFHADGSFVVSFDCPCGTSPGLAVDASNVYADRGSGKPAVITTSGEYLTDLQNPGTTTGLAADVSHGDLYIDQGNSIAEYDTSAISATNPATLVQEFGSGALSGGAGIAVNTTGGDVYVADSSENDVEIFGLGSTPPAPNTDPASAITSSSATLNGDLNPGGSPTDYYFTYSPGSSCAEGPPTPLDSPNGPGNPATGSSDIPESAQVTGLQPSTQYSVCFVAQNAFGQSVGPAVTFDTAGIQPVVEVEGTQNLAETDAVLFAQINPENQDTHYYFEYSTDPTLTSGVSTAPSPPGEDISPSLAGTNVTQGIGGGLTPNTTYYYRAVASNGTGTIDGPIEHFTSWALTPTASTNEPAEVTDTTARLSGVLDGMGADTHYYFNYGLDNSYGGDGTLGGSVPAAPGEDAGVVSENTPESVLLTGLSPHTTYHYQLFAQNVGFCFCDLSAQRAHGTDVEFTTLALPPVAVADPSGGNISPNSATVTGSANLQGVPGSYQFEYGPSTAYGSSTAVSALGGSVLGQAVSANLSGLTPNTTYHYRLLVANDGGTEHSADETFTTYTTAPVVATGQATGVGADTATLGGSLNPQGADTTYWFQYGTTTYYSASVPAPEADAGSGTGFQSVTQAVSGLAADTTYHFRLVTNNAGGTSYGADQTFTTTSAPAPVGTTNTTPTTTKPKASSPPGTGASKPKSLTRGQKLVKALKACKRKSKKLRAGCERQAQKRYGKVTKKKSKA
jgi:phosphodiesterase/alkaline phosphatase D-like protein